MTWTDAQGRPELFMHPDIIRGTAGYRIVDDDDDDNAQADEQQLRRPLVRRPLSPIRAVAAAKLAADRAAAEARRAREQPN